MTHIYKILSDNLYRSNIKFLRIMQIIDILMLSILFAACFSTLYIYHTKVSYSKVILTETNLWVIWLFHQISIPLFITVAFLFVVKELLLLTVMIINKTYYVEAWIGILWSFLLPVAFESLLIYQILKAFYSNEEYKKALSNQIMYNFFISIFILALYLVILVVEATIFKLFYLYFYSLYYWIHALVLTFTFSLILLIIFLNSFIKFKKYNEVSEDKMKFYAIFLPWKLPYIN